MILLCYGTRPEWIKIKPLIKTFQDKIPFRVLFSGQHEDISGGWFDISLDIEGGKNRLDSIISSVMNNIDFTDITYVLVQGDTATCFAVALSAFNHKIPVIHLEAGLRTYNLEHPYPEEGYRQMISRITDIHLCPTTIAKSHLLRDSVGGEIHVVGNTVLVIRHPNPIVTNATDKLKNVNVIDPLSHDEMVERIANCKFLITDSGGLQEEGSFFNKKIIICRETTERPEVLKHHGILCKKPEDLSDLFNHINSNYIVEKPCPFGDGKTSNKIMELL